MTKPGRKPWAVQNLLSDLRNIMKIMLTGAYNKTFFVIVIKTRKNILN